MNVFDEQPISKVVWMLAKDLNPNDYNPNRVLTDEFKLLALNIVRFGWIQPILINKNNIIIDGFHRWKLSIDSKELYKKYSGRVPCVVMDISDREAMLLTIRMNRAKGVHEASSMAKIAKKLIEDYGMTPATLRKELGMSAREVELLLSDTVFEIKDIDNWQYSKAWYPYEDGKKYGKADN
jgi:ParB-like chromosome segregation protein Spo0J|tara:strand:- start:378 stop:920 length:543 start_codon:yes stop_codon:yes gene_type:complete